MCGTILVNVDLIAWDILMGTTRCFRAAYVAACAGYYAIGARVIHGITVAAVTAAYRAGLTLSVVHVVVVGWIVGDVGCHATIKVVELSCELYCAI